MKVALFRNNYRLLKGSDQKMQKNNGGLSEKSRVCLGWTYNDTENMMQNTRRDDGWNVVHPSFQNHGLNYHYLIAGQPTHPLTYAQKQKFHTAVLKETNGSWAFKKTLFLGGVRWEGGVTLTSHNYSVSSNQ